MPKAFQDYYPESYAQCYGCGHLNPSGHHFKTYWDGEESLTRYTPNPTMLPCRATFMADYWPR